MKRVAAGFTLIEVLVAVAIFGLVSIGAYTVLDAAMRSQEVTESRLNKLEAIQRAVQTIERDIRMLSLRQVRDEYGDKVPLLRGQSELSGQSASMEFTRADWRNPAGLPRSNLQHLNYRFEQGKLSRFYTIFLDKAANSQQLEQPLLEEMQSMKLSFLDDADQWQSSWAMNPSLDGNNPLPKAVKLELEMEPFGLIERILLISAKVPEGEPVGVNP